MRRSIATVSLSGSLKEKIEAIAAARFDAVEIFENDLLFYEGSATEIRSVADNLGLQICLFQPFRDFEAVSPDQFHRNLALDALPLRQMAPFRVIAIAMRDRSVAEFRWNQDRLVAMKRHWITQHWFSSGFDESIVQAKRAQICKSEWEKSGTGTLQWLRALHQSHV